jgi:citronellyl-CoA dehydrogenase
MIDTQTTVTRADALWHRLVQHERLTDVLYRQGDPARGLDAKPLHELMHRLDSSEEIGPTLGICVQATAALPILAAAAGRAADPRAPLRTALAGVLAGDRMVGMAATDTTPGSDLSALTTTVEVRPDGLILEGGKQWITNALYASHLLVLARHSAEPRFTSFTWVVVPTDAPGVTIEAAPVALFDGSGTGHAGFVGVRLPKAYLGSAVGRGLVDFTRHISVERLGSALWALAMCRRVLRETIDYLRHRGEGPANLWAKEEIRRQVARCVLSTDELGSLIGRYQDSIVDDHDALHASLVKASAARAVDEVLSIAAHLQGARAFADGGLHTLRAKAGLWSIGGGTYEVMLSTIADRADRVLAALP